MWICHLYDKRDSVDLIKLRFLRWGDNYLNYLNYLGQPNETRKILTRETEGRGLRVRQLQQWEERLHGSGPLTKTCGQPLEKARKWIIPRASRRSIAHFRLLTSRVCKITTFCFFKSLNVSLTGFSYNRKLLHSPS